MNEKKPTDNDVTTVANPFKPQSRFRAVMTTLVQWSVTVVMVLAFFLFLIWGASYILPEGTSLINLDGADKAGERAGGSVGDIELSSSGAALGEQVAAILSEVHKTVKHKSAKTISWVDALKDSQLFDQDAVKTASESHAVIKFDESNKLRLGPDSLVIVRRLAEDSGLHERRPALVIMEGELRGTMVASTAKKPANVEVIIPGGVARINRTKDSDEAIDYQIKVNPDESTSVVVYRGIAEVEAQNKKVELGANQITVVVKGAAPTKPKVLPDDVKMLSPANEAVAYYRDFPQEITFGWAKTKEERYRLMIARDALYENIVLDEVITSNEFIHGDLRHGTYFWRVASVTNDGTEGQFSKTHWIEVIQDLEPPRLRVIYPENAKASAGYILSGSVEPGATLIVNDVQVNPDDQGRFQVEVILKKGMNVVVAQAVDRAGNATFVSERVFRDF